MALPPPLLIRATTEAEHGGEISVQADTDSGVALFFGSALRASRQERGFEDPLTLAEGERPPAVDGQAWIPHVFCFEELSRPALVWERLPREHLESRLSASLADVERWAGRPQLLLRLLSIAGATGRFVDTPATQAHLSFRWIMANQEEAAEAASEGVVEVEHVSIHVDPAEEEAVAELFVQDLGLIEIPRPTAIKVPGRWLQAGRARIHLNSRAAQANEADFPGPRPNHICFGVADLEAAGRALEEAGIPTRRAGSLGRQLWFRLAGTTIELQPLRR